MFQLILNPHDMSQPTTVPIDTTTYFYVTSSIPAKPTDSQLRRYVYLTLYMSLLHFIKRFYFCVSLSLTTMPLYFLPKQYVYSN
jgi:hypothetical protein